MTGCPQMQSGLTAFVCAENYSPDNYGNGANLVVDPNMSPEVVETLLTCCLPERCMIWLQQNACVERQPMISANMAPGGVLRFCFVIDGNPTQCRRARWNRLSHISFPSDCMSQLISGEGLKPDIPHYTHGLNHVEHCVPVQYGDC